MGIKEPGELSDEEYNRAFADYLFLQSQEREFQLNIFRQVLIEFFGGEKEL